MRAKISTPFSVLKLFKQPFQPLNPGLLDVNLSPRSRKERGRFIQKQTSRLQTFHDFENLRGPERGRGAGHFHRKHFYYRDKLAQMRLGHQLHSLQCLSLLLVTAGIFQSNTNTFILFVFEQGHVCTLQNKSGRTHRGKPTFSYAGEHTATRTGGENRGKQSNSPWCMMVLIWLPFVNNW